MQGVSSFSADDLPALANVLPQVGQMAQARWQAGQEPLDWQIASRNLMAMDPNSRGVYTQLSAMESQASWTSAICQTGVFDSYRNMIVGGDAAQASRLMQTRLPFATQMADQYAMYGTLGNMTGTIDAYANIEDPTVARRVQALMTGDRNVTAMAYDQDPGHFRYGARGVQTGARGGRMGQQQWSTSRLIHYHSSRFPISRMRKINSFLSVIISMKFKSNNALLH